MLQQRRCCENEAACLLAAVLVDGRTKCNYSRYIGYTPMQSIIAVRKDDQIIDVHLTTLLSFIDWFRCFKDVHSQM